MKNTGWEQRSQVGLWMNSIKERESERQRKTISLIPSENDAFPEVIEAVGSKLSNKYSEGYPGRRYYGGNDVIDEVESTAIDFAKKVFHVPFANVQPYSGSIANDEVYESVMEDGDKFMGLHLFDGGHLTHGWKTSSSSKRWKSIQYHVNSDTGLLDMEEVRNLAITHKPKLIWCGATAYSRIIPFKEFGEIADECGAYLAADISHIAGLVAGGVHRSPHTYVHIMTTTTHKTLRGPRAAMIMVTEKGLEKDPKLGEKINSTVFPGKQGGPHNEKILGVATMLKLVDLPFFKDYARQIVKNSMALSYNLVRDSECNLRLVSGGTDNHLAVVDLSKYGIGRGVFVQLSLERVGIICNKNTIPGDKSSPFYPSGIRIGTPVLTSRGAVEKDMDMLSSIMVNVIRKVMAIVNNDEDMKKFPGGTKEDRALVLRKFKEIIKNDGLFEEDMINVEIFIDRLEFS